MKKFFWKTVVCVLTVCMCLSIVACGSQPNGSATGDTFTGAVSEETFTTKEDAATAFLENEISGISTQAVFVAVEAKAELDETEIATLSIDADAKESLVKVEEILIFYRVNQATAFAAELDESDEGEEESETLSVRAYLLTYEDGSFRYFVPPLLVGEPLTKSYFDSVFDVNKYLNCTFDFKSVGIQGGDSEWNAIAKVESNGLYEKDWYVSSEYEQEYEFYYYDMNAYGFVMEAERDLSDWDIIYNINNDFAEDVNEAIEGVLHRWFGSGIDYTFFEKTETGFALDLNKKEDFLFSLGYLDYSGIKQVEDCTVAYNVFIENGRIVRLTQKFTYTYRGEKYAGSYDLVVKDFGTTVINLPDELKKAAQEKINNFEG